MGLYSRFGRNSRDIDSNLDKVFKDFIHRSDNKARCCECQSPTIRFISVTFHCILCSRCGNAHIDVLPESVVKSIQYPDNWSKDEVRTIMNSGGNKANSAAYNGLKVPFPYDGDIDKNEVDTFLTNKYVLGKYMKGRVDTSILYKALCSPDEEHNYTQKHSSFSSAKQSAPSLPSKPRPSSTPSRAVFVGEEMPAGQSNRQPKTSIFDGTVELQPFYDQSTGQVYVDRDQYQVFEQQQKQQQQYQQQQLLQQQQYMAQQIPQNQLPQQQYMGQNSLQNQTILSMYSQPGVYQSGVEIGPSQPQYGAVVQQQSYLQQNPAQYGNAYYPPQQGNPSFSVNQPNSYNTGFYQ